jgi:hypothetical protein
MILACSLKSATPPSPAIGMKGGGHWGTRLQTQRDGHVHSLDPFSQTECEEVNVEQVEVVAAKLLL